MYTKESIFPLYVGKCEVNIANAIPNGKIEKITGVTLLGNNDDKIWFKVKTDKCGNNEYYSSDNCTLLLKPLSKMSEEDMKEYRKLTENGSCGERDWIFHNTPESFLWLINHGYAISDELFELKIAEETNG